MARRNQGKINRLVPPDTSHSYRGMRTIRIGRCEQLVSFGSDLPARPDQPHRPARIRGTHSPEWDGHTRSYGTLPLARREEFHMSVGRHFLRSEEANSFAQRKQALSFRRRKEYLALEGHWTVAAIVTAVRKKKRRLL